MPGPEYTPHREEAAGMTSASAPMSVAVDPTGEAARAQSAELMSSAELMCSPDDGAADPGGDQPPQATPTERFQQAMAIGDIPAASPAWAEMDPAAQTTAMGDDQSLAGLLSTTGVDAASVLLHLMGLAPLATFLRVAEPTLIDRLQAGDQAAMALVAANPEMLSRLLPPTMTAEAFAGIISQLGIAPYEQLQAIGLFGGALDYDVFMRVIGHFPREDRRLALEEIRVQGKWDALLASLTDEHVTLVQSWLATDAGDGTNQTLDERIAAAHNSARGVRAKAAVDSARRLDFNARITDRLRELLVLGVALPKLEGQTLAEEGVLSVLQVERACHALTWMPQREYLRLSLLLEMSGDASRLQQSFLLLEATAARADDFGMAQQVFGSSGDLAELEGFADQTRGMDRATLIEQTSVTQSGGGGTGMIQKFTDSCGPTSAQVVRAEADPVEALKLRQTGQLGQDALDTDAAREQESSLERHNAQTAVPRGRTTVMNTVNAALAGSGCSATEQKAIVDYMSGAPFDAAKFATAMPKLQSSMGASFPGADALRMVRESAGGTGVNAGLTPGQLTGEMNGPLGVDDPTGRNIQDLFDLTLWNLFAPAPPAGAGRQINAVNMTAWNARVTALLDQAATKVERGEDVIFIVYWNGGGGHFMTFTNVRTVGGVREFLVHDPWTGTTSWFTQPNILAGNWSSPGLICGLQG